MVRNRILVILFVLVGMLLVASLAQAQFNKSEGHIEVSMRMIGHEILLYAGDSTSRVLPIEKDSNTYKIQFETDFGFNPEDLESIIDSVVKQTNLPTSYLVEIKSCISEQTVYSFEKGKIDSLNIIPCKTRDQPLGCYLILFSMDEDELLNEINKDSNDITQKSTESSSLNFGFILVPLFLIIGGLLYYFFKKKPAPTIDPDVISIGKYELNKRSMKLSFENSIIMLTSKESDLLIVLHDCINNTIERDVILNSVWGDEGDYVGRTLDVFISKLRKKLEADATVKIVNVRGVGYRLVVE